MVVEQLQHVVIVGGGISGLAAAYRLRQALPGVKLTLIESDGRLGGKIITERVDGFVIEGGPDSFLASKPRGIGLCHELGLEPRLQGTSQTVHRSYVMRGRKLYELPEGLTGLIPSRFGPMVRSRLISPAGKLRMALDYVIPSRIGEGDESLAAFTRRRLGPELYERLIEPLMSGIYAGDGEQLSLAATFPQLRQAERVHGSLIRGMLANQPSREATPKRHSAFLAPRTGLAEIVEALIAKLERVDILLEVCALRVTANRAGQDMGFGVRLASGEELSADAVILATPAFVSGDLLADVDTEMASALRSIPHVSTATVSVAYPLPHIPRPLDAYGYIVPRVEGRTILACTWTSTKFPHRAPEGFALIRAFVGRAGQEGMLSGTDDDLVALVRAELRETLGITAAPALARVFRWPKAMPQYTLGHLDRLALIERRLATHPGLFVAGNAYHGVGIPDCIASGETAAERAAAFLRERERQTAHEHATIR
jgi:oxygen-dependent protoporphyrinogen oxidase